MVVGIKPVFPGFEQKRGEFALLDTVVSIQQAAGVTPSQLISGLGTDIQNVAGVNVGFFSGLLDIGKKIIGGIIPGIFGTTAAATTAVAPTLRTALTRAGSTLGRAGAAIGGAAVLGGAFAVGSSIFTPEEQQLLAAQGGVGGGNGFSHRRTIVLTIRNADGVILRREALEGAPKIMNKDIQTANRVFRTVRKMGAKLPTKKVRTSRTKMLMTQLQESALEAAITPRALCPPPALIHHA